ncbi:formate dehydrogenase subunit gamma [Thalassospira lucentensis]|uniref:formate dehydrogenase subunit gamma n=1 Tax=Thalassospira lucentensis TaxID=168935 RepID=UPI0003B78629|nr:formate dehydrogenase subunit gamma [Thalassospira lucentensis]RCK20718.1 ATP synthase subunit E [Thalassospira lucentensis MCCC 1A00383 = DSM 14000]
MSTKIEEHSVRVAAICDRMAALEGPLLPILHEVQEEFGHIPEGALQTISKKLNLSRAEVHGVASFYHDFREEKAGKHVIKICRAEACQAMGADDLGDHAKSRLKVDWSQTTSDQKVTLEPVFCLGLCACAPAAMVDGKVVGRVSKDRMNRILDEVGA